MFFIKHAPSATLPPLSALKEDIFNTVRNLCKHINAKKITKNWLINYSITTKKFPF